ncbi:MAG: hypothetical protein M3N16_06155 [Actinomycetota bacterium]|nr:hypothetical protein [Actinomycetota bacterium]
MASPQLRPLAIGEILDVAIKICVRNAATLAKIVVVVVAPVAVLGVVVSVATAPEGLEPGTTGFSFSPEAQPKLSGDDLAAFAGGAVVVGLLSLLTVVVATGACFKAISDAYLGARPDWRASLGFALARLRSLVWLSVLSTFLVMLAFLALIIPGIWLGVAWAVAVPVLLFEGVRGRKSLGRSFRLVRGRWWPTFGGILVGFVLAAIVGGILGGILVGATVASGSDDQLVGAVVNGVANMLSSLITTPFQAAVSALIYYDLRVRKEGFDLELLAERIGVQPAPEAESLVAGGSAPPPGQAPPGPPPSAPTG